MPLVLSPPRDDQAPVVDRLERLAGRLRRVTVLRNGSQILAAAVVAVAAACALDVKYHLPSFVRALALVGVVAGVYVLWVRRVSRPLRAVGDPLKVALLVEERHPDLHDLIASAVQFDNDRDAYAGTSPLLRKYAVVQANRAAERLAFDEVFPGRGAAGWVLLFLAVAAGAIAVGARHRAAAGTALQRFAVPYGVTAWTSVEILAPAESPYRLPLGEPFDVRVRFAGSLPTKATFSLWLDGTTPQDRPLPLVPDDKSPDAATLDVHLEPERVGRDFKFRVRAGDADTGWQAVAVRPPPLLVPLDGRPSPQLRLDFPAYTDLPPAELPAGAVAVECVAGTRITLRAATDRPVTRAWIAFQPDRPTHIHAAMVAPFAAATPLQLAAAVGLVRDAVEPVAVSIADGGKLLEASFVPKLTGPYVFRFESEPGLGGQRIYNIAVAADEAPRVELDRPAGQTDVLTVLPDAAFAFKARVTDKAYAVRSAWLEYRTGPDEPFRPAPLYDHAVAGRIVPLAAGFMPGVPAVGPLRLRVQSLTFDRRLSVADFRRPNGDKLKDGDALTLRVAADDFDDVSPFKPARRSAEVTLQIVGKGVLETALQQAQGKLRNAVLRLHALEREARTKVQEAIKQAEAGPLRPEDRDKLLKAEELQKQLRSGLDEPKDGVRPELEKWQRAIVDNKLPRSATTDRLDAAAAELERISRDELDPLETDLSAARKEQEDGTAKKGDKAKLAKAEARQKEVETTLQSLLERLEPFSGAGEVRGEARSVAGELGRQIEAGEKAADKLPPDAKPDELSPDQKAELDKAGVRADRLAERGRLLVEKMTRVAAEKDKAAADKIAKAADLDKAAQDLETKAGLEPPGSDAAKELRKKADEAKATAAELRETADDLKSEAAGLRKAVEAGDADGLKKDLRDAGELTKSGKVNDAVQKHKAAADKLGKAVQALDDQKNEAAERLAKKLRTADERIDELFDKQERLQKKAADAAKLPDGPERKAAFDKLAKEEEALAAEAETLSRKLNREQAPEAAEELRRAAEEMTKAKDQLERGEEPAKALDEALDRIDEAQKDVKQAKEKNDEALLREKLDKFADQIKNLRDRHKRACEESVRLHAEVKKAGKWPSELKDSLNEARIQQTNLADEVRRLVEKKFTDVPVFERMLKQAAEAMDKAAARMKVRLQDARELEYAADLEDQADAATRSQQDLALKRMDQLLDALKPDKDMLKPPPAKPKPAGGMPPGDGGDKPPPADKVPPLAQLKALKALQIDLAERTAAFDKAHPDRTKLNEDEAAELESIEKAQLDVAELIQDLNPGPPPAGGMP